MSMLQPPRHAHDRRVGFGVVLLAALQVTAIVLALRVNSDDPFSLLVFSAIVAPLAGVVAFLSPSSLLLASPLLVLFPWSLFTFFPFEWALFLSLFAAAVLSLCGPNRPRAPSGLEVLWALYGIWAVVALSQAADLHSGLAGLSRILTAGLAFVAGRRLLGRRHAHALLRVMALLALAVGLQLLGTILVRGYSLSLLASRVLATTELGWGRSNYVAAVATLAAGSGIALLFFGNGRDRILGSLALLGAVLVQVTTLSRGALLALLIGLLLAGLLEARRRLAATVLLIGAVAAAYFFSPLGQATLMRFTSPEGLPSIGVRLLFFREALAIWRQHWLLGAGPDQIPFHTALYMDANPHNIFLKQMTDLGVVGLALYLALLTGLARAAVRARRRAQRRGDRVISLALVLGLGIALVNAQYEPTLGGAVYGFLFWLGIGTLTRAAESPAGGTGTAP